MSRIDVKALDYATQHLAMIPAAAGKKNFDAGAGPLGGRSTIFAGRPIDRFHSGR